jgi:hypothetical protein
MTRTMGRRARSIALLVLVLSLAGLILGAPPAAACSCVRMDLAARLPDADGAFVGTYVDRDPIGEQHAAWTFEVERVVKGSFGPTAIVRTHAAGASCGIELFDDPRTGLLLDRAEDGVWESSLCQQVAPEQLLQFASGSHPPDPAVAPIGTAWSIGSKAIAIAISVVVAAAVLWWWARRRRGRSADAGGVA